MTAADIIKIPQLPRMGYVPVLIKLNHSIWTIWHLTSNKDGILFSMKFQSPSNFWLSKRSYFEMLHCVVNEQEFRWTRHCNWMRSYFLKRSKQKKWISSRTTSSFQDVYTSRTNQKRTSKEIITKNFKLEHPSARSLWNEMSTTLRNFVFKLRSMKLQIENV